MLRKPRMTEVRNGMPAKAENRDPAFSTATGTVCEVYLVPAWSLAENHTSISVSPRLA